jgi:hypothetical protein
MTDFFILLHFMIFMTKGRPAFFAKKKFESIFVKGKSTQNQLVQLDFKIFKVNIF